MLKRKIESVLEKWKDSEHKKPLVIKGIRQCGKTYIVQKFAKENYDKWYLIQVIKIKINKDNSY